MPKRAVLLVALLLGLAGCATEPAAPLPPYMSPYPAGKYAYGYEEQRLSPDTWRVTYHGPWQELPVENAPRHAALERSASATNELALLRASQIVQAEGKPAFAIVDRRTDTETQRTPGAYVYDPYWPRYSPLYYGARYPYWHAPLWTPPTYIPGNAAGRSKTTLVIRLAPRVTPNTVDAASTARRLEETWAGRAPTL